MTEIHQLYAETAKPSWAGGTYNSEKSTEGQSFDFNYCRSVVTDGVIFKVI